MQKSPSLFPRAVKHIDAHPAIEGFSLIEILISLAIAAILVTMAYPSFQQAMLKGRRLEAWAGLQQIQLAQARYRMSHPRYGNLEEIGWHTSSQKKYYAFQISHHDPHGYTVSAFAQAAQTHDFPCQHLQIQWHGLGMEQRSGSNLDLGNTEEQNRNCWPS